MKKVTITLLFMTLVSLVSFSATDQEEFVKVAQNLMPSIVNIRTKTTVKQTVVDPFEQFFFGESAPRQIEREGSSLGSGFVISEDGEIVTNNHVIEGASEIFVKFDNKKEYEAEIVGKDPETDIALLKIINTKDKFKPVKFADSDFLKVGQWAIAIGNPYGLNNTMTLGIISAIGRSGYGIERIEDFIQTDASINPGNSGGPLIDIYGNVIGVNTAIISKTGGNTGIGFAIPSNIVKKVVESIQKYGEVRRPFMGVRFQPDFTSKMAESMGLKDGKGALIAEIVDESPAADAGLMRGDVITAINGRVIETYANAIAIISSFQPGEEISVTIFRKGKERNITLKLGSRSDESLNPSEAILGMQLRTLNEALRDKYKYSDTKEGVVVLNVDPSSQAARIGIKEGYLIVEINNTIVKSLKDLKQVYNAIDEGENVLLYIENKDFGRYILLKK